MTEHTAGIAAEIIHYMHEERGASDDMSLANVAEGCHSKVYLYEDGPLEQIVRIPKCPEALRAAEANAFYLAEDAPAPKTLHVGKLALSGEPIIIEEYIVGRHKDINALEPSEIYRLAVGLASVHNNTSSCFSLISAGAPICSGTHGNYLQAMLEESVLDKLRRVDLGPYPKAEGVIAAGVQRLYGLVQADSRLFSSDQFSALHHDLNNGNMLWRPNGSVCFIDWNITFGDPADDVAYLVADNDLSPDLKAAFLDAYYAVTGREDVIARVGTYTLKNQLDDLVWVIDMKWRFPRDPCYDQTAYEKRLSALQTTLG